jgi:hypothetical protein
VKLRPTITISFCLNLALAGTAVHLLKQPASLTLRDSAATISEMTPTPTAASLPVASNSPAAVTYVTNRFAWSTVEAEDFEQLATNLRTIGCPEKTVRDVVVARARRRLEQLSKEGEPKLAFWAAGLRRARAQREAERQLATARAKVFASVERAVGRGVFTEDGRIMEDFVEQAIARFLSGPISEEKILQLAGLIVRQKALVDEVRAKTHGVWLEEDEAALQNLGRQFHQELAALLRPSELEEFTARPAIMKLADRVQFEATDLTPAEIRAVALIRARFHGPAEAEWFEGDSLTDEQEAQATQAVREFLGEARFVQLERAGDRAFQELFEVGREYNLPQGSAVKAFELRRLTAQEVARLAENKSISEVERQQQLAQVLTQAQEGVLTILGAGACAQYLNRGGAWLTNLSGL